MGVGLHSAIHTAHMGLGAAEKTINVSGDNLANANTIGFKANRADFASFLSYNYSYGYPPYEFNAGSNPMQIGMGVELASTTTDFSQGTFKEGMTDSDIAINGEGFLIAQLSKDSDAATQYFTRNGALKINENFDLVTNTGLYVMGYTVDDQFRLQTDKYSTLKIPIGEKFIAEATQNVSMAGILNAVGDSSTQGNVLRTAPMTDLSKSAPTGEMLTAEQLIRPDVETRKTTASGTTGQGGGVEPNNYIYRFAYIDANGVESDYSTTVTVSVANNQNAINLTELPNVPAHYSQLRVYRAVDPGDARITPEFYFVADVSPASTNPPNTFTDTRATSTITDPSQSNYRVLNQGRLNGSNQNAYQYYVTFVDASGNNESRPSPISDPISVSGGQVLLSDIPIPDSQNPDNWVERRIYRSLGNDPTSFHLVGTIDNIDPNATLIDRVSDAELATKPELSYAGHGNVLLNDTTKLVDVGQFNQLGQFVHAFDVGTLTMEPSKGGNKLPIANLKITEQTTVGEYLRFLNQAFGIRTAADNVPRDTGPIGSNINDGSPGASVNNGSLYITGNSGSMNELAIDSMRFTPAEGRTEIVNQGWTSVQEVNGESITTSLSVFDSLGANVAVKLTMVLQSKSDTETVYRWYADSPDNQPYDPNDVTIATGTGLLYFDQHGKLFDHTNLSIHVERSQVASESPLIFDFNMNVGALMALDSNQPTLIQTEQDGAAAGTLYKYTILSNGTIMGTFEGGTVRPLGQILTATFRNQEGLFKAGDSLYQVSNNSGDPRIDVPGTGGRGVIKGNSIELSNTDIGNEIVNMILASAMYRANAKVMTTSNEMFDAMLRII